MMSPVTQSNTVHTGAKSLQKILIVDDEPDINTIARISLESFGKFNVETCSSGIEALKKAEWFEPNLILLDVMMPFMDGEETLRKLKRNPKTTAIPVIFVTAKIFNRDISKYKQMGALDVIPKPFDPVGLPKQIREIWSDFQMRITAEHEIQEKLKTMRLEFVKGLSARLSTLRTEWANYLENERPHTLLMVYEVIHKIAGVSGTVQHETVYRTASQIERILGDCIEDDSRMLRNDEKSRIFELVSELGRVSAVTQYVA